MRNYATTYTIPADTNNLGEPQPAIYITGLSLVASCTGSTPVANQPLGQFIFQVSNEEVAPGSFPTRWADLTSVQMAGNVEVSMSTINVAYRWVQVVYLYNQGTGGTITVDLWFQGPQ